MSCRIVLLKYNNVNFIKYKPDININNTKGQILRLFFYGHDKKMCTAVLNTNPIT